MSDQEQLQHLMQKLEILLKKHQDFSREIEELRNEISLLNKSTGTTVSLTPIQEKAARDREITAAAQTQSNNQDQVGKGDTVASIYQRFKERKAVQESTVNDRSQLRSDFEKFIGEILLIRLGFLLQ